MTDSENADLTRSAHPASEFSSRREMRAAGGYARPARSRTTREVVRARSASSGSASTGSGWRRRVSSAGVMAVVVGLFASLTLPAFADQDGLGQQSLTLSGQSVDLGESGAAASVDASAVIRDSYGTTSAADLRRLYADAMRQRNLAAYLASGARALGDDYPWPEQLSRPQGGGLSPLNYYYRECVDFVAWRLNRDAGSTSAPFRWVWSNLAQSSAYGWKRAWDNHGWPSGSAPEVGAVAWFPGGNHVGYVSGILADGSVVIEEYNYSVDHGYSQRIIPASGAYYLYAPPS